MQPPAPLPRLPSRSSRPDPEAGPVSIEGYYDEVFAIPGMIRRIREADALV